MNTPTSEFRPPISNRPAFTLIELLIVITVIGILVGLLLPAIRSALNSANELSVRTEMVQIEQGIESFKTEYGFYPPSFEQFDRSPAGGVGHPGVSAFVRYLNRIAPNHQEASSSFPGGGPRVVVWWNRVGRYLDQQGSLVFWLSGLCKSKQFPLTGGADYPIPAFNASQYSSMVNGSVSFSFNGGSFTLPNGDPFEIERDVRFEFQPNQQLFALAEKSEFEDITETNVPADNNGGALYDLASLPTDANDGVAMVAAYRQGKGPSDGDLMFRYRDSGSYFFPPYAYLTNQVPSMTRDIDFDGNADTVPDSSVFLNPKTFQLISLGLDGEAGLPNADPMNEGERRENAFALSTDSEFVKRGYDNMTNFANGRLELFVIENE